MGGRNYGSHIRNENGQSILEFAGALAVLLPLICLITLVVWEISQAYTIGNCMSQGAGAAARALSLAYGQSPTIMSNRGLQESQVFNGIRVAKLINNSAQFDNPVFDTSTTPGKVSVTVRYLGGQYSLPAFPTPDPLNLGSHFQISASSTFPLE